VLHFRIKQFNISERKLLLRILDVVFALSGIIIFSKLNKFSYFDIENSSISWYLLLSGYILFFGTIFEMYDLRKSESKFKILKILLLSILLVVLFYLLTPIYTPSLPSNRIEILYFFFILFVSISLLRFMYITFITSPRFLRIA
jgi:predicted MFS family arabinose efflux permease